MDVDAAVRGVLDGVLVRFGGANPELPNGFAEHAPMGAEAMLALGLDPAAVAAWAARHDPVRLDDDAPIATRRVAIRAALDRAPWTEVLRHEVAVLAPHVGAHLFHGLIRTAHAARALDRGAGAAGLDELATGLAAWHVWAGGPVDADAPAPATGDPHAAVLDAARRGAGACATAPSIFTIHAVTGPMAFTLLMPWLDDGTVAAAASAFARTHARHGEPGPSTRTAPPTVDDLARLLDHWDAHPAKLTEAALRGFVATGDGVFLDAVAAIMGPWPTTNPPGSNPTSSMRGSG